MPEIEVTHIPELDRSLLPAYQEYVSNKRDPRVQGLWDFLYMNSNHEIAAAFSKLFWPDFIEVDGLVLLAERYPKMGYTPEEYKEKLETNPGSIEFLVNTLPIGYMFYGFGMSVNEEGTVSAVYSQQLKDYLARTLLTFWKYALKEALPDKEFTFLYLVDPDGADRRISFFQSKWANEAPTAT